MDSLGPSEIATIVISLILFIISIIITYNYGFSTGILSMIAFSFLVAGIYLSATTGLTFTEKTTEASTLSSQLDTCTSDLNTIKSELTACNTSITENSTKCEANNAIEKKNALIESIEPNVAAMETKMAETIPKLITSVQNTINAIDTFKTDNNSGNLKTKAQQELTDMNNITIDTTDFDKSTAVLSNLNITNDRLKTLLKTVDRVKYLLGLHKTGLGEIVSNCEIACSTDGISVIRSMNYTEQ